VWVSPPQKWVLDQKRKQQQYLEALKQTHSLTIKMEITIFFKMLACMYQTTLHHVPEDNNLHTHGCDNLICYRYIFFYVAVVVHCIVQMCLEMCTHTLATVCSHSVHLPVRRLWMLLSMLGWWQILWRWGRTYACVATSIPWTKKWLPSEF
jgi:hypothetical protein